MIVIYYSVCLVKLSIFSVKNLVMTANMHVI